MVAVDTSSQLAYLGEVLAVVELLTLTPEVLLEGFVQELPKLDQWSALAPVEGCQVPHLLQRRSA